MADSIPVADLDSFRKHLRKSKRILALLGAGLSAASGLPTFRGAGGLWRDHDATHLATPEAFDRDPGLVWQFYGYRRHMALKAKPNAAHYALAELAKQKENFLTLSQNVDGLSPRANHPDGQLYLLHGSLFDIKCSGFSCDYIERNNYTDPVCPALAIPTEGPQPEPSTTDATSSLMDAVRYRAQSSSAAGTTADSNREADISNSAVPLPTIPFEDLPLCPKCKRDLLRPGVVWFGEALPSDALDEIDRYLDNGEKVDLIMVIGTSGRVFPAAAYVSQARSRGARVAVINTDPEDRPSGMRPKDWFFEGDASVILPKLLEEVTGDVRANVSSL